jgi:hypothetical protein
MRAILIFIALIFNQYAYADALTSLAEQMDGRWRWSNGPSCEEKYHIISVDPHTKRAVFLDVEGKELLTPYGYDIYGVVDNNRIRMFMDGEDRKGTDGKLRIWHFILKDKNTYAWGADDVESDKTTEDIVRCPK